MFGDVTSLAEMQAVVEQSEHKSKVILAALYRECPEKIATAADLLAVCSVLGGMIETIIEQQPEKGEEISDLLTTFFGDYLVVGEIQ